MSKLALMRKLEGNAYEFVGFIDGTPRRTRSQYAAHVSNKATSHFDGAMKALRALDCAKLEKHMALFSLRMQQHRALLDAAFSRAIGGAK